MLDSKLLITKGMRLVDLKDGAAFIVLCSCPSSRPRRHTSSYVKQHRDEFATPDQWRVAQEAAKKSVETAQSNSGTIAAQAQGNSLDETTDPIGQGPAPSNFPDQESNNVPTTDSSRPEAESH